MAWILGVVFAEPTGSPFASDSRIEIVSGLPM